MNTMTVYAVGDRLCPLTDAEGFVLVGRYVARDVDRTPRAEGEQVPDTSYYRRRLADGDLTLTAPVVAQERPQ